MSGPIGSVISPLQQLRGQNPGSSRVEIHLGSSEYQFNQVLDLVAPGGGGSGYLSSGNAAHYDEESIDQVNAMLNERDSQKSAWNSMAATVQKHNFDSTGLSANLGRNSYKVYSNALTNVDISKQSEVIAPGGINFQY
ncbi:MAG: hypothetical protein HQL70_02200 [Magnetococcales bacterium]|nr:hypothetical protein [Magnetococcales bacterium]